MVMLSTGVMMMFESNKMYREIQLPVANVVEQTRFTVLGADGLSTLIASGIEPRIDS